MTKNISYKWQVFVSISPFSALLVSERFVVLTKTGSWSSPVVTRGRGEGGDREGVVKREREYEEVRE